MDAAHSDEDDLPLATLKHRHASAEEDDLPLSHLCRPSSPDSASSFLDDSDADPDFKVGLCEVKNCKEDVWAACEKCLILVCYDHCVEDIDSCNDHGKLVKASKKKKKHLKKSKVSEEEHGTKNVERVQRDEENCAPIVTGVEDAINQEGSAAEKEGEKGDGVQMLTEVEVIGNVGTNDQKESTDKNLKVQRGRKRTRNPERWKRNLQKRLRDTGHAHISTTGRTKPARKMGPACGESCIHKCSTVFSETAREAIFKSYWDLGDKREQRHYITRHVERLPAQRKRVGSVRKMMTFRYYMYTTESRVQVCRLFFLNTHNIGRDFIYGTMDMQSTTGVLKKSKQGVHECPRKVQESSLQGVRDHITSFALIDSHYCRATTSKKFLDPSLSVSKMYKLYFEACPKGSAVSEFKYRQVFDTEFNLGFHRPKKDQCETCVAYRNKLSLTEEDKEEMAAHQKNKEKARQIKDWAKSESKLPIKASCAFDMQQILLCPHGQSSSFYYKRRLGVFNFTIFNYGDSNGYCYMWPETEARRGPNEVSTCLFDYMKEQAAKGKKEIYMFSDNCGGQNRNRYTAFAIWYARKHFGLQKVCHTFMEKGHTETENDSIHATIERATRHIELYTPQQWYTAVRTARSSKQPYVVKEMVAESFIDFKTMSSNVKNLSIDENGEKVMWSKTRQVVASEDDPNAIAISSAYDGVPQRLDLNRRNRKSSESVIPSVPLVTMTESSKPGIVPAKKVDLLALCDAGQIPQTYRKYFDSLDVGNGSMEPEQE